MEGYGDAAVVVDDNMEKVDADPLDPIPAVAGDATGEPLDFDQAFDDEVQ